MHPTLMIVDRRFLQLCTNGDRTPFVEGNGWDMGWRILEERNIGPYSLHGVLSAHLCLHSSQRALSYRQGLSHNALVPTNMWDMSLCEGVADDAFVHSFLPEHCHVKLVCPGRMGTCSDKIKTQRGGQRTHVYEFVLSSNDERSLSNEEGAHGDRSPRARTASVSQTRHYSSMDAQSTLQSRPMELTHILLIWRRRVFLLTTRIMDNVRR